MLSRFRDDDRTRRADHIQHSSYERKSSFWHTRSPAEIICDRTKAYSQAVSPFCILTLSESLCVRALSMTEIPDCLMMHRYWKEDRTLNVLFEIILDFRIIKIRTKRQIMYP